MQLPPWHHAPHKKKGEWIMMPLGAWPPVPAQPEDTGAHYPPVKVLVRRAVSEVRIPFFSFLGEDLYLSSLLIACFSFYILSPLPEMRKMSHCHGL
jgi:hypothetical protein